MQLVFVHGALVRDGQWWWEPTARLLRERTGVESRADPVAIADNGDGTIGVSGYDETSFGERFLHDADETTQRLVWDRVTAPVLGAFTTPTTAAGWQGVDSTYVVCADDRSTSPTLQREHAQRATRSIELPTGHHPFISRPDLVVDQIEALLR